MHHYVYHLTQIDHSVVKAIFHFLNSSAKNLVAAVPFEKKFHKLKLKIKANFIKKNLLEVKNIFYSNWLNIEYVDYFIKQNFYQYEPQLCAIVEKVQNYFKTVPCNNQGIVNFPVNDPGYFEELSYLIIPEGKKNDPRYMLSAKAFILFLFMHGEFGRKTSGDPPSLFAKLIKSDDNPLK